MSLRVCHFFHGHWVELNVGAEQIGMRIILCCLSLLTGLANDAGREVELEPEGWGKAPREKEKLDYEDGKGIYL